MEFLNKNYILLLLSQLLNTFSGLFFNVVIIILVYNKTNSVSNSTLVLIITTIAAIISGIFNSFYIDDISYKKIMFFANLINGISLLLFMLFIKYNGINLMYIYLLTFILSFVNGAYSPSRLATVALIVKKDLLVKANGIFVSIIQIMQTTGWIIAFPITDLLGVDYSILFVSICYILSSFSILGMNMQKSKNINKKNVFSIKKITDGIEPFFEHKLLKSITIMDIIENFANVIWMPTFLLAFTTKILNASENWWGYQGSAFFLGLILGGILVSKYSYIVDNSTRKSLIYSSFLVFCITLVYVFNKNVYYATFLSFLIGIPAQLRNVLQESLIQKSTDSKVIARVFSFRDILLQVTYLISLFIASRIADKYGIKSVFIYGTIVYLITTLFATISPSIRKYR
ncbi:MFS transporter [Oceanivirga miroungae]|uniref:MFS transporter n=1 Tax=Oceanivirga miroungae TaxID=1130046 RepID=A0A6I8MAL1_9FUSO|nr:MFS transporter [Oceanivirga miroungae]VWL85213.1 hypothetical protein OMES3154_00496 [Oceanivirga miroungae]